MAGSSPAMTPTDKTENPAGSLRGPPVTLQEAQTATLPASAIGRAKGDLSACGPKGVRKDARLPTGYGSRLEKAPLLVLALAAPFFGVFGGAEWNRRTFAANDLPRGHNL